jgi:hypothetical protein
MSILPEVYGVYHQSGSDLATDTVIELALVLGAVEMALRFGDERVVVDLPEFVAADANALACAARSGVRSR